MTGFLENMSLKDVLDIGSQRKKADRSESMVKPMVGLSEVK